MPSKKLPTDKNCEVSNYSLTTLIYHCVAKRYSVYKNFDNKDLIRMKSLLNELDPLVKFDKEALLKITEKYDMLCIRSQEDENLVIFKPNNMMGFPVSFLWRFGTVWEPTKKAPENWVYPLILESPHEGTDNITRVVSGVIENVRARAVLFNGVHPDAGKTRGNGRASSDVAHAPTSLFNEFQKELTNMYPYLAVIQFHGMGGALNFQCLVGSSYNSQWAKRSIPREFCKGLAKFATKNQKGMICACCEIEDEVDGRPVSKGKECHFRSRSGCLNTCVQARTLNFGGANNKGRYDTGRFAHIETGAIWRGLIGKRQLGLRASISLYSKAIEYAMENWQKMPYPDFSNLSNVPDILDDDPDIDEDCKECV